MKKSICVLICAVSMLSLLSGCGKSDSSSNSTDTDSKINGIVHDAGNLEDRLTTEEIEIDAVELNNAAYENLLFEVNPEESSVNADYKYIDTMYTVGQLRRVKDYPKYCYGKYINTENDSVCAYVFYEKGNDYAVVGAVEFALDSSNNTVSVSNNIGDISESVIGKIAGVDLPFGEATVLE